MSSWTWGNVNRSFPAWDWKKYGWDYRRRGFSAFFEHGWSKRSFAVIFICNSGVSQAAKNDPAHNRRGDTTSLLIKSICHARLWLGEKVQPYKPHPGHPICSTSFAGAGPEAKDAAPWVICRGGFCHMHFQRKLAQLLLILKHLLLEFAMLVPVKY